MVNKMAEFPGKLANFRQKAASLREAARGGGLLKISKLRGGILEIFDLRGGYFGYTPPLADPCFILKTISSEERFAKICFEFNSVEAYLPLHSR